jgi:hypothetical protein
MLDSLITSKTRLKLLLKFFMNSNKRSYLRSLADEFNESTNAVRVSLNRLSEAGILNIYPEGNTVMYQANQHHPLFSDISNIVKKYIGIDKIIDHVLDKWGNLKLAVVTGDYAKGKDTGIIDLVLVGDIDKLYMIRLVEKAEKIICRKVRYIILNESEYEQNFKKVSAQKILILLNQ